MIFVGGGFDERPLFRELVEKVIGLKSRLFPGRGTVVLEHHPTGALLDAGSNEQRQPAGGEVFPVRDAATPRRERPRTECRARMLRRTETSVFTPACARRTRSASDTGTAGRSPGRRIASSLSAADHTGHVSSERATIPAAAPQEANVSTRPRSRSNACTRGKNITALSLRNGQMRRNRAPSARTATPKEDRPAAKPAARGRTSRRRAMSSVPGRRPA